MDYGVRVFRHVVAQVFGNLAEAGRISLAPVAVVVICWYWVYSGAAVALQQLMAGGLSQEDMVAVMSQLPFGRFFLVTAVSILMFAWLAVAWHRFVLVEEYGGAVPPFSVGRILGYVWRSFLIGLLIFLVLIPILLVIGGLIGAAPSVGIGLVFGLAVNFLVQWLVVRWSLILPAWSIDRRMRIGESWEATRDVSGEILVPIIGFAVIFTIIQQVIAMVPVGIGLFVVAGLVYWVQTLLNLALLTTLFGNRVEGRELN